VRVLVIARWYPNQELPWEGVFVREHALAVAPHHEVRVLHWDPTLEPVPGGARLEPVRDPSLTAGLPTFRLRHRVRRLPFSMLGSGAWHVRRVLDEVFEDGSAPDLLHAHVFQAGALAALASAGRRLPFVVTEHYTAIPLGLLGRRDLLQARLAYGRAARTLPVSGTLQRAIEGYGLRGRFEVVPNPIDTSRFYPPPVPPAAEEALLLFVGRLAPAKGPRRLVAALELLAREGAPRPWRAELLGDGPLRESLARQIEAAGLSERVALRGPQPSAEVADSLRRAELLVAPSEVETFGCSVAEALMCGVPVVAHPAGSLPEVLRAAQGEGIFVEERSPAALAAALRVALTRDFDRAQIARATAERFSMEAVGRSLSRIYEEVSAESAARS